MLTKFSTGYRALPSAMTSLPVPQIDKLYACPHKSCCSTMAFASFRRYLFTALVESYLIRME